MSKKTNGLITVRVEKILPFSLVGPSALIQLSIFEGYWVGMLLVSIHPLYGLAKGFRYSCSTEGGYPEKVTLRSGLPYPVVILNRASSFY